MQRLNFIYRCQKSVYKVETTDGMDKNMLEDHIKVSNNDGMNKLKVQLNNIEDGIR